jgi:hypothetical protein
MSHLYAMRGSFKMTKSLKVLFNLKTKEIDLLLFILRTSLWTKRNQSQLDLKWIWSSNRVKTISTIFKRLTLKMKWRKYLWIHFIILLQIKRKDNILCLWIPLCSVRKNNFKKWNHFRKELVGQCQILTRNSWKDCLMRFKIWNQ